MKILNSYSIKQLRFWLLLMIIGLILCLAGCTGQNSMVNDNTLEDTTNKNTELVLVEREISSNYDPNFYPGSNHYIKNGSAEALFKVDEQGVVQPSLAKGFERIDKHTWHILLRPEAKFWSGVKIDSEAVIASLERSRASNIRALPMLEGLTFTPLEEWRIKVDTERSNLFVPLNLSYMELCIINADKSHDSVETMDMSGMYKVVQFEPKKSMILEINDNYYGEKPNIERIIHEAISDQETRSLAVLSQRADIAMQISNESIAQLKMDENVILYSAPASNTGTIYLNLRKAKFEDIRVRQALAWGLDREELVLLGSEGLSTPTSTWLSSNPKYKDQRTKIYSHYDFDKAEDLLEAAGWVKRDDGMRYKDDNLLHIKLMTWGQDKALGETIQNQWSKLGISVEVQYGDYSLIMTAREEGEWDASIEAWTTFGDEYALLSTQFSPEGSGNYGGFNNSQINNMLEELKNAETEQRKVEIATQIDSLAAELAPSIYMYPRVETTAVNKRLKGFQVHFRQFENAINNQLRFE